MEHGVDAVSGIAPVTNAVDLEDVTNDISRNSSIHETMSTALSNAIEHAASTPGHSDVSAGDRADLIDPFGGEFGEHKADVLSEVERDGAETSVAPEKDGVDATAEALRGLMQELTTWHVTWGIAQSAQKDLTHVLKT